jgi:GNAT superfamily N-acetyltransferase
MEISITFAPATQDLDRLRKGMRAYELSVFPGLPGEEEDCFVAAFVRDGHGEVQGGIEANIYWDGVEIKLLWIAEALRNRGFGSRLLAEIEAIARSKGAVVGFLKTVAARDFYQRNGYEVYGVLEDRPIGSKLFHMKKRLSP